MWVRRKHRRHWRPSSSPVPASFRLSRATTAAASLEMAMGEKHFRGGAEGGELTGKSGRQVLSLISMTSFYEVSVCQAPTSCSSRTHTPVGAGSSRARSPRRRRSTTHASNDAPASASTRWRPLARAEARSPSIRGDDRHAPAASLQRTWRRAAPSVETVPAGTRRSASGAHQHRHAATAGRVHSLPRHDRALRYDAVRHVAPQRNDQFAGERHNPNAPRAFPARGKRRANHCVRALAGCHRTQPHAS